MDIKLKLKELLNNSYAVYSNYNVSCVLETKDNNYFYGVNVENASYGATICAERSAITNAITNGYKKHDFKRIYIMNPKPGSKIIISNHAHVVVGSFLSININENEKIIFEIIITNNIIKVIAIAISYKFYKTLLKFLS